MNMYYRESINKALSYINHNLENNISIEEISCISGFSTSHFYKLFSSLTGFTIKQYIRNKRLAKAAKKLVKTNNRVIDIAMDANFQSHEVFTRAFLSLYGVTPLEYRKNRNDIMLYEEFNSLGKCIKDEFRYIENDISINVETFEEKEIYLVGMDIKTSITENIEKKTIHDFWHSKFLPNVHEIKYLDSLNKRINFEITNPKTKELYHLACFQIPVPYSPRGMLLKILPKQKYAVFTPEKPLSALEYSSLITYAYGEWLPISGYELADNFTFDVMYRKDLGEHTVCNNMKVYIPIK